MFTTNVVDGTGPIWLDNVYCVGNELLFDRCFHSKFGVTNCLHFDDVGVRCTDLGKFAIASIQYTYVELQKKNGTAYYNVSLYITLAFHCSKFAN